MNKLIACLRAFMVTALRVILKVVSYLLFGLAFVGFVWSIADFFYLDTVTGQEDLLVLFGAVFIAGIAYRLLIFKKRFD